MYAVHVAAEAEQSRATNFKDASPREVRAALVPEEQSDFDRQWREALGKAAASLDLTDVHEILDSWRRRAWITSHLGHDGYRHMLARGSGSYGPASQSPAQCHWKTSRR